MFFKVLELTYLDITTKDVGDREDVTMWNLREFDGADKERENDKQLRFLQIQCLIYDDLD